MSITVEVSELEMLMNDTDEKMANLLLVRFKNAVNIRLDEQEKAAEADAIEDAKVGIA